VRSQAIPGACLHPLAPGVSAPGAGGLNPPRFCSAVVPHAPPTVRILATATQLRHCDSLRVPDSGPPDTAAHSFALIPLPRDAWCVAGGSLASCRPTRRRRIPSCSKRPRACPMRGYLKTVVVTVLLQAGERSCAWVSHDGRMRFPLCVSVCACEL
jgi:hypothetical protein